MYKNVTGLVTLSIDMGDLKERFTYEEFKNDVGYEAMRGDGAKFMVGEKLNDTLEDYNKFLDWLMWYCEMNDKGHWLLGFTHKSCDRYIDTFPGSAGFGFRYLRMEYLAHCMDNYHNL